ncbi:MAG TPA: hypothetical protein PK784_03105 [Tenuifilaceae bacterium]|nr:hypothetical protein [Tenuifilaceae bacterium]HPN20963.1 hypothetical protein [Tenuifilaceae bacterium]
MKSFYAVIGQMILSGSNYLVFLIFTFLLGEADFIGFSTAVALNILAYAIAEGGVSYVAPREISRKDSTRAILSGGFIGFSIALYLLSLLVGFFLWNIFSKDSLSSYWVIAYALYFFPVLIIPSWATCWSIDIVKLIVLASFRGGSVLIVYLLPSLMGLYLSGIFFMSFTVFFVIWLNRSSQVFALPNKKSLHVAINKVMEVFLSKTSSYVVYSLIPLVVASIYGNRVSSLYLVGERVKSMYSTFFQPLIQTVYLAINKKEVGKLNTKYPAYIVFLNIALTFILLLFIFFGGAKYLGDRFNAVSNLHFYIIAACFSILTSCLLYFKVLPTGNYRLFRVATYFQMITFIVLFVIMRFSSFLLPEIVLLIGEFSILSIVSFQLFYKINKK